jgi:hypothetical protein
MRAWGELPWEGHAERAERRVDVAVGVDRRTTRLPACRRTKRQRWCRRRALPARRVPKAQRLPPHRPIRREARPIAAVDVEVVERAALCCGHTSSMAHRAVAGALPTTRACIVAGAARSPCAARARASEVAGGGGTCRWRRRLAAARVALSRCGAPTCACASRGPYIRVRRRQTGGARACLQNRRHHLLCLSGEVKWPLSPRRAQILLLMSHRPPSEHVECEHARQNQGSVLPMGQKAAIL